MAENKTKQPEGIQAGAKATLIPKTADKEGVKVPTEYASMNGGLVVQIDHDEVTICFNASGVAEEIGAYRRCKVKVKFKEGKGITIIPEAIGT